jgi:hypothetical protein
VLVYAVVVIVAALIPLLTRGSYTRLLDVHWRFRLVLFGGLGIQIALEYVTIPRAHWHDVGFGLLVASYVLILAFAVRNLVLRGMGIVFIAIACNFVVIVLNQGMPFKVPVAWQAKSWAQPTVKHHPQQPDDKLRFLSDIIVLRSPFESAISFGDLILAVGLCDVAYNASRRPKSRRPRAARGAPGPSSVELARHEEDEQQEHPAANDEERPLVLNRVRPVENVDWFDAGAPAERRASQR